MRHHRPLCALRFVSLSLLASGSTGCAALFAGSSQEVHFNSIPPGADVSYVNGNYIGQTPLAVDVARATLSTVVLKKEGYEDAHVFLEHKPSGGWFAWDMATCIMPLTLCIPLLVDAVTGAWFRLDEQFTVKMSPAPSESRR